MLGGAMVNTTQSNACAVATKTADKYPRFAQLPAAQKAQARAIHAESLREDKTPLVDCYFGVTDTGVVAWLFWSNPNS